LCPAGTGSSEDKAVSWTDWLVRCTRQSAAACTWCGLPATSMTNANWSEEQTLKCLLTRQSSKGKSPMNVRYVYFVPVTRNCWPCHGSGRPLTAEARVRSHARTCGIFGG
jgi:hypothetical protein